VSFAKSDLYRLYIQGAEDEKEAQGESGEKQEPKKKKKIKCVQFLCLPSCNIRDMLIFVRGFGNSHIARYFVCYGLLGIVLVAAGLPLL
jgi:hypothetical protein